jgi:ParB family chromosome partitioning protein
MERLRDFRDHPFRIKEDQEMKDLMDSIRLYGILTPLIVRPLPDGVYEIVSGHRRKYAAKMLGYRKVPVIIRVLTDDDAIIGMVDSNLHRAHVLPSEKAFAIKMKYEAIKRNNGRKKKSGQEDARPKGVRSIHILSEQTGDSAKKIQRYLKRTELMPELLEMLDNGKNSFNPAYLYYTISKGTGILISVEEKAPKFMRILFMAFAPDL